MPTANAKLTTAVEDYLTDLRRIRALSMTAGKGGNTPHVIAVFVLLDNDSVFGTHLVLP